MTLLVFALPNLMAWYQNSLVQSGFASAGVALVGALGITRASLVLTVRTRLHEWADLLCDHAVVGEVAKATLTPVTPPRAAFNTGTG